MLTNDKWDFETRRPRTTGSSYSDIYAPYLNQEKAVAFLHGRGRLFVKNEDAEEETSLDQCRPEPNLVV